MVSLFGSQTHSGFSLILYVCVKSHVCLFLLNLSCIKLLQLFLPYSQVQDYKEGTPEEKTYYIELWDVGGSVGSASSVKSTRAVFYNSVNGKDDI